MDSPYSTGHSGGPSAVVFIPAALIGGALLASLLIPLLAGGGALWLTPVFVVVCLALYGLLDRAVVRRERERGGEAHLG